MHADSMPSLLIGDSLIMFHMVWGGGGRDGSRVLPPPTLCLGEDAGVSLERGEASPGPRPLPGLVPALSLPGSLPGWGRTAPGPGADGSAGSDER